jgi:hypothetical protein
MNIINFVSCGQVGDLIHQLYVIKCICGKEKAKANLYIAEFSYGLGACGNFTFDLNKSYEDTSELILSQNYINEYKILPRDFQENYINLNKWRDRTPFKTWTELLSEYFNFDISQEYKWMIIEKIDDNVKDKILIHNSNKRHNEQFNWGSLLDSIDEDVYFLTTSVDEYNAFRFKGHNKVKLYLVKNVNDMAIAINSCRLFIGNQSLPFAIASSLDILRICELHSSSSEFYTGEHKYSEKISWFLNTNNKHNSNLINIQI